MRPLRPCYRRFVLLVAALSVPGCNRAPAQPEPEKNTRPAAETPAKPETKIRAVIYLADLKPRVATVATSHIADWPPVGAHSFYAHPDERVASAGKLCYSLLVYDLSSSYSEFTGAAAIGDIPKITVRDKNGQKRRGLGVTATPLTFRILGDGRLLWRSRPLQRKNEEQPFEVDISSVRELQLRVDCPGVADWAWAIWKDAVLKKKAESCDKTSSASGPQQPVKAETESKPAAPPGSPPTDKPPPPQASSWPSIALWTAGLIVLSAAGLLVRRAWARWHARFAPQGILPLLVRQHARTRDVVRLRAQLWTLKARSLVTRGRSLAGRGIDALRQQFHRWAPKARFLAGTTAAYVRRASSFGYAAMKRHAAPFFAHGVTRWRTLDRKWRMWTTCTALAVVLLPLLFAIASQRAESPTDTVDAPPPQSSAVQPALKMPTDSEAGNAAVQMDVAHLVAKVDPAVVTVRVIATDLDQPGTSQGSGFVVDGSGVVVTNYHVVEGAHWATVVLADKTELAVKGVVLYASGKDLALLKVDPGARHLSTLPIAQRDPAKGEKVYAFGAPMGLSGSVSDGLVASIRQGTDDPDTREMVEVMRFDPDVRLIQTTAPISPGNSGGPLVNSYGEVVGVNTLGTWFIAQNLNFAVSAAHVRELMMRPFDTPRPLTELPRRPRRID